MQYETGLSAGMAGDSYIDAGCFLANGGRAGDGGGVRNHGNALLADAGAGPRPDGADPALSAPAEPASDLLLREDAEEEGLSLASQSDEMAEKTIAVWLEDGVRTMPLESYVCGVVAAEMPAAYHLEALKAQAVAAAGRWLQPSSERGYLRR